MVHAACRLPVPLLVAFLACLSPWPTAASGENTEEPFPSLRLEGQTLFTANAAHQTVSVVNINPDFPPDAWLRDIPVDGGATDLILLRLPGSP